MLKSVLLNGDTFSVSIVPQDSLKDHEGEAWADLDIGTQEIRLAETSKSPASYKMLGHEIIHQVIWRAGLHEHIEKETEEALCWAVGASLVEIIRDNPQLVEEIREAYGKGTASRDPGDTGHPSTGGCCDGSPGCAGKLCGRP